MHQNKITICLGTADENRTRLNLIDNQVPYPEDYDGKTNNTSITLTSYACHSHPSLAGRLNAILQCVECC
jgi:hypothetical protein